MDVCFNSDVLKAMQPFFEALLPATGFGLDTVWTRVVEVCVITMFPLALCNNCSLLSLCDNDRRISVVRWV